MSRVMRERLFQIAVVQPHTYCRTWGSIFPFVFEEEAPPETKTLEDACEYVSEAARQGARYVAFPEMYPGPMSSDSQLTLERVTEALASRAREHRVWVLYGGAEVTGEGLYNTYGVLDPHGELAGRYRKMIPACGEPWLAGREPVVVEAGGLRLGLAICWEAWFPEIPRALAWMGADVLFFPTGALVYELKGRWSQILAARAAENLVYTVASVNLLAMEDGMAAVHSPERLMAESPAPGILYAEVDLERLDYLRRTDEELSVPKKYRSIPGLLRAVRPEILEITQRAYSQRQGGG